MAPPSVAPVPQSQAIQRINEMKRRDFPQNLEGNNKTAASAPVFPPHNRGRGVTGSAEKKSPPSSIRKLPPLHLMCPPPLLKGWHGRMASPARKLFLAEKEVKKKGGEDWKVFFSPPPPFFRRSVAQERSSGREKASGFPNILLFEK